MKKIFDIAFKDLTQYFRNKFALVMMFAVPILLTAMFYVMFGGLGSDGDDAGFELPITQVIVVNQDAGEMQFDPAILEAAPEGFAQSISSAGMNSMGSFLTEMLQSPSLADVMVVTVAEEAAQAKAAVDNQDAGVAIIFPDNLSDAYMNAGEDAVIEFYQDPALTLGPSIVQGILEQFVDSFLSSRITLQVTFEQLEASGQPIDESIMQAVLGAYFQNMMGQSQGQDPSVLLNVQDPTGEMVSEPAVVGIISMMMAGMSVFYLFFAGASIAQGLLTEEVKGTLPRLFTTPTPKSTILGGKFTAGVLMLSVQILVLMGFGWLVFQIEWGKVATLVPLLITTILAAATFGIFLVSWMENERQAGFMIGGLVTILGMMGMLPIFVFSMPNPPQFVYTLSKLVPQGWAVQGLQIAMEGGAPADVVLNTAVLLLWTIAFFTIGVIRFRKRFA